MKDVFISYSTQDQEAKNELVKIFDDNEITYFLDENDLKVGENINQSIESNLRSTRFTVLLVSENSLLSPWVSKEILFRLMQEQFHNSNTLLPILLDDKVFQQGFEFEIYDKLEAQLNAQKEQRKQAEERKMNTAHYNTLIERLERILPNISDIFHKLSEGLSANFFDESRKENDLQKIIEAIKTGNQIELPESIKDDLISDRNTWVESLYYELQNQGIALRNKPTEIFKCYGWLIEAFLQKMQTKVGKENSLRRLSFMADAYQSSLRLLSYIQLAQIIQEEKANKNDFLSEFLQLASHYEDFPYLEILNVSTEILAEKENFVPEIQDFVNKLNDSEDDLFGIALFLENFRGKLLKGEISETDENFESLLDEYLTALVYWLREITFIAKYRLVSIKNIELNYSLGFKESFLHLYGELHGIYIQDIDESDYSKITLDEFTYNQSVLLLKGSSVEIGFDKIKEGDYLSLSPLIIDQSVFSEDKQTPEIYYYLSYQKKKKLYNYAQYKNEMPLQKGEEIKSNKKIMVKAQNNQQPKFNELYKQLEKLLKPLVK